jgi:hypothetical protein
MINVDIGCVADARVFLSLFSIVMGEDYTGLHARDSGKFLRALMCFFESFEGLQKTVSDLFGGLINHTVKSNGTESVFDEPFHLFSIPVIRGDLQNALVNFTRAQEVFDADCQLSSYSDTTSEHSAMLPSKSMLSLIDLESLPLHMMFHLQRFSVSEKIPRKDNRIFLFPETIDLCRFCSGVPSCHILHNQEATFQLAGVVVHEGSLSDGHFYSLVRDRVTNDWNLFDDREVKSYSGNLKEVLEKHDLTYFCCGEDSDYLGSAFILVYDRVNAPDSNECRSRKGDENKCRGAMISPHISGYKLDNDLAEFLNVSAGFNGIDSLCKKDCLRGMKLLDSMVESQEEERREETNKHLSIAHSSLFWYRLMLCTETESDSLSIEHFIGQLTKPSFRDAASFVTSLIKFIAHSETSPQNLAPKVYNLMAVLLKVSVRHDMQRRISTELAPLLTDILGGESETKSMAIKWLPKFCLYSSYIENWFEQIRILPHDCDAGESLVVEHIPNASILNDNPTSMVGRRLEVCWSTGCWYAGTISAYDQAKGKYHIVYDDGEKKKYNLRKKSNWKFCD